jgi:cysteine desulfurase / selenocysteine lyase
MALSFEEFRRLMPVTERFVYFNHAGTGPLPSSTVKVLAEFCRRQSETGEVPYAEAEEVVEQARRSVAELLHLPPSHIAFTKNTSAGVQTAIGSLEWQAGDNVVLMKDDFPTVTYPFLLMLPDIEKRWVTSEDLVRDPGVLFRLVDGRTRCVAVSWVHFLTGRRFDVQAICRFCRERGVFTVIDAIQGIGVLDFDWSKVDSDIICSHGAKWLLSPQGSGFMAVRPESLARMKPYGLGWLSAEWKEFNDIFSMKPLKPDASRFEESTKGYLSIYGLNESVRLFLEAGLPAIAPRVRGLASRLRAGLESKGFEVVTPAEPGRSAGMVTCRKPGLCTASIHAWLKSGGMVCALRENLLRVAPHYYNTEEEVDRFVERAAAPEAAKAPPSECKT